jgi:uncharacterized iron-regulated protein
MTTSALLPRIHDAASLGSSSTRDVELSELARRAAVSDVVLIGELHDHPVGLPWAARFFDALAEHALASSPPRAPALAMEFLERDVQGAVDELCSGTLDEATFLAKTKLRPEPWQLGHGGMVQTARRLGLPVIAANAPRTYTKLARTEGYAALRDLPEEERALFALPAPLPGGRYRESFAAMMGEHEGMSDEKVASYFEAQALWDATMSDSVVRALDAGRAPVVLVVGRFHVDHDGGVVQLLRRAKPEARLLAVSMIESAEELDPERAQILVEVGPAPERAR